MAFAHGYSSLNIDRILVVNNPVKDGFSNSAVFIFSTVTVNPEVPVICVVVGAKNHSPFAAAGLDDFKEIIRLSLRKQP